MVLLILASASVFFACNDKNETHKTTESDEKTYNYSFVDGGKSFKYEATIKDDYLTAFNFSCDGENVNIDGSSNIFRLYDCEYANKTIKVKETIYTEDSVDYVDICSIELKDDGTLNFLNIPNINNCYFPSALFAGNYSNGEETLSLNADGTGALGGEQLFWKSYFGSTIVVGNNKEMIGKSSVYSLDLKNNTAELKGKVYAQKELKPFVFEKKIGASPMARASKINSDDELYLYKDTATYVSAITGTGEKEGEVISYDYYYGNATKITENKGISLSLASVRGENVVQSGNTLQFMWTNVDEDNNPISFDYVCSMQKAEDDEDTFLCQYYYGDACVEWGSWCVCGKYRDIDANDDYFEIEDEGIYFVFNKNSLDNLMYIGKKGYVGVPDSATTYYCDNTMYILLDSVCYYFNSLANCMNPGSYVAYNLGNKKIYSMRFDATNNDYQTYNSIMINDTGDCVKILVDNDVETSFAFDSNRSLSFNQTSDYSYLTSVYDAENTTYKAVVRGKDLSDISFYINFNPSDDLSDYSGKIFYLIEIHKMEYDYFMNAQKCYMVSKSDTEIRFYQVEENGETCETRQYTLKINSDGVYQYTDFDADATNLAWE